MDFAAIKSWHDIATTMFCYSYYYYIAPAAKLFALATEIRLPHTFSVICRLWAQNRSPIPIKPERLLPSLFLKVEGV